MRAAAPALAEANDVAERDETRFEFVRQTGSIEVDILALCSRFRYVQLIGAPPLGGLGADLGMNHGFGSH
jgi:hypothetical protein